MNEPLPLDHIQRNLQNLEDTMTETLMELTRYQIRAASLTLIILLQIRASRL